MTNIYAPVAHSRARRGYMLVGIAAVVIAAALVWSPISAYFAERASVAATQAQFKSATKLHATLLAEIKSLNDLREVAYLAKTELNMVYPGQRSYLAPTTGQAG